MRTVYLNIHNIIKLYKNYGLDRVIEYVNRADKIDFVDNMAHDIYKKIKSKNIELVKETLEKYLFVVK